MSFLHRVKSFFISAGTLLLGAIATVAVTNPSAVTAVLGDIQAWIDNLGLWASVAGFVGLVLNEVVRHLLNKRKIAQAQREGNYNIATAARNKELELY